MKSPGNYGTLIATYIGGTLWSYAEYGSYQGDYVAFIYKDSNLLIYKGSYGSCSGCDFIAERDEIPDEEIKEYMESNVPLLTIPADSLPKTEEDFIALLPANTRTWMNGLECKVRDLVKQINSPTCNNLDIIETEAKNKGLI